MNRIAVCISLICINYFGTYLYAQKNDNVWLIGYKYGSWSPVPALDFYFGPPDTVGIFAPFNFYGTNGSICDNHGNLRLYTNGVSIANQYNQIVSGSTGFNNSGGVITQYGLNYLGMLQCAIILPFPDSLNKYVIFHIEGTIFNTNELQPFTLNYSIIDMNLNNGLGNMTLKNNIAVSDTLLYSTLQSTKHGNGRDWWVVIHKYNSDKILTLLFTNNGVDSVNLQSTGHFFSKGFTGQSTFSPDGSKFAIANRDSNTVTIYDFDRCSGTFSLKANLNIPKLSSNDLVSGCSFSPNSKYLYVSNLSKLYQYDITFINIDSSQILIDEFDWFADPFFTYFNRQRLGPDGKIYMNTGNATGYLHVINNPDSHGSSCNFGQHQLKIINYQNSLPEFPNYRLGALTGSVCDSIPIGIYEISAIDFYISPNPSSGNLKIEYNALKEADLIIYDINGKIVFNKKISQWSTVQNISLPSTISNGLYNCVISSDGLRVSRKVAIIRQ